MIRTTAPAPGRAASTATSPNPKEVPEPMTKTDRPKRSYGFLIEEEKFADCPSVVARVLVREGNAEYPINPRSEGEDEIWDAPKKTAGLALQSLEVRSWVNTDPKLGYFHGPDVRLDNARFIDERLAKRLLTTMSRVNRAIRKADAREAGDVLMAVGKAIGAEWYVKRIGKPKGSFYSEERWEFCPLVEGREEYRRQVEKLKALLPAKKDDAA